MYIFVRYKNNFSENKTIKGNIMKVKKKQGKYEQIERYIRWEKLEGMYA